MRVRSCEATCALQVHNPTKDFVDALRECSEAGSADIEALLERLPKKATHHALVGA